jgi:hypothetical protein
MSERVARALERIKIVYLFQLFQKAPKVKERKERQLVVYARKGSHFLRIVWRKVILSTVH